MAITNFIPTVWSQTLAKSLEKEYIAVKNCNRDFEGSIKGVGDKVKINSIGAVTLFDYTKNTDMSAPATMSDSTVTLSINRAKAFNFQIDDVDKTQANVNLLSATMREAANAIADDADAYIYSLYSEISAANTITVEDMDYTDVVDTLILAREKLLKNNVNSNVDTVLEVSPEVAALILKSKILQSTDNEDIISNGYIGSFIGFDVYVSNNIVKDENDCYKCFARTKRAIAYADQLNAVEAYRPEKRFADAVKGLHLYGAKIVYPGELFLLDISVA
ncbi:MAG: hypothetical protein J5850_03860 [Clostridia bacterium]|nr:hypothetical protein [Clostridia bacterium]